MSEELDMIKTYESMLGLARMQVTKDGFVRMELDEGEYVPVTAREKRMVVLPYEDRLRDKNVREYEIFHLLGENNPKDSDLLSRYRHWLINRFNLVIGGLGVMLLEFVADKELTKRLSPDQKQFLELVPDADKLSTGRWKGIQTVTPEQKDIIDVEPEEDPHLSASRWNDIAAVAGKPNQIQQVFISMYVRQAAVLHGKSYNRVAVVNFPFYDELKKLEEASAAYKNAPKTNKPKKPADEVFGCEVKVKDREPFMGIMKYLLPDLDVPHKYDVGSNSRIAPSLDAMMLAWLPIATHLNAIVELFMGVTPAHDRVLKDMLLDLRWAKAFENLDALWPQIRSVPPQNVGAAKEPAPEAPHATAPAPRPVTPTPYGSPVSTPPWEAPPAQPVYQPNPYGGYQAPYGAPPPAQGGGSGGMSVSDMERALMGGRRQPQQNNGYYPQQQGYGSQGGYYQPPQQQQAYYSPPGQRRQY